jgi:hypothetical protein
MIIRRRLTRRFTTVDNRIFDDERLSAEGMGVLVYLISRPDDWQVRLTQLGNKFRMGRDKIQRVMREIIAAGYAEREWTRDSVTGAFTAVEYVITDEPARVQDAGSNPRPEKAVVDASPQPGLPSPENTVVAYKKDSTKTERDQIERDARASDRKGKQSPSGSIAPASPVDPNDDPAFVGFMTRWPTGATDNRQRAHANWIKLSEADQRRALDGIDPYRVANKANGRKWVCAAATYLADQPWKQFAAERAEGTTAELATVAAFTRTWWFVFHDRLRLSQPVRHMVAQAAEGRGYSVPAASLPTVEAEQGLTQVATDSPQWRSSRDRLAVAGIRLPDIAVPFVWLPGSVPTVAAQAEIKEGDSASSAVRPQPVVSQSHQPPSARPAADVVFVSRDQAPDLFGRCAARYEQERGKKLLALHARGVEQGWYFPAAWIEAIKQTSIGADGLIPLADTSGMDERQLAALHSIRAQVRAPHGSTWRRSLPTHPIWHAALKGEVSDARRLAS